MVVILMISRFSFKSSLFYIQWSGRWPLLAIKVKTAIIHFGKRLLHSICSLGKTTGWITFAAPRHHSGWNLPLKSHFSHSLTSLIIKNKNCQKSRSLRSLDFNETFFGDFAPLCQKCRLPSSISCKVSRTSSYDFLPIWLNLSSAGEVPSPT